MIDMFKSIGKIQMEFTEKISRLGNLAKELIPKIELPKLTIPQFEIDYDEFSEIIKHNSKYGWTLTGTMELFISKILWRWAKKS